MINFGPGCFQTGKHFTYAHIFIPVSIKAFDIFEITVPRELCSVSKNMG